MNRKRGEVDFLVEDGLGEVIPLEIKSGWSPKAPAVLGLEAPYAADETTFKVALPPV